MSACAAIVAMVLAAGGPQVEPRAQPGSSVDAASSGELTSANAGSVADRTPGNLDVAVPAHVLGEPLPPDPRVGRL